MLNRMLGAGVFSTGSTIYALSGSVGTSLMMWFAGTVIAFTGLLVYMELGTALPRNGGEKNYLEYMFPRPKFLVTAMYASYVFFLGWASGNSIVVGEYILNAAGKEVTQWNSRGIGLAVITFAFLINGINVKAGLFWPMYWVLSKLLLYFSLVSPVGLLWEEESRRTTSNLLVISIMHLKEKVRPDLVSSMLCTMLFGRMLDTQMQTMPWVK